MNSKNDLLNIGELYGKTLLNEVKTVIPKGTFKMATDKKVKPAEASPKAFVHKDSGPIKAAQTTPSINTVIDPAKMTKKQLETNLYDPGKFSQKNESSGINIHMSKKFDDLFKDVMSDKLHLREDKDIETVEDVAELPELGGGSEGDDDLGDLGEDEVKSPEEIIDNIIDLLAQLRDSMGGGEAGEDSGEEDGMGDLGAEVGAEKEETYAAEETELEEVKDSVGQSMQKGEKVKTSWKPPGGKAQNVSAYKQTTNDGEAKDSDLHNPKKKIEVNSTVKAGRQIGQ